MLVRIRQRFHIRAVEWLASTAMIALGLYLLVWPYAFLRAGLSGFAMLAPQYVWTLACVAIGLLRIGALILNGHRPQISAPVRCVGAILGVGLFASVAVAYALATDQYAPPMAALFAVMFTLADLYSAARSGFDSTHALAGDKKWIGSSH